jgi:hypothetical protein
VTACWLVALPSDKYTDTAAFAAIPFGIRAFTCKTPAVAGARPEKRISASWPPIVTRTGAAGEGWGTTAARPLTLGSGLTYSFPAALLFWMLPSRWAILYPKLMGATAGGCAGLIGLSVLEVECSNLNLDHILIWHWGVILLCAVGGLSLGAAVEYIRRPGHQSSSRLEGARTSDGANRADLDALSQ